MITVETAIEQLRTDSDAARDKLINAIQRRFAGEILPENFDVELNRYHANVLEIQRLAKIYSEKAPGLPAKETSIP